MNYIWGAVALVLFGLGFHFGGLSSEAKLSAYKSKANAAIAQAARQEAAASEHARAVEKASQERVERLAKAYQEDKRRAEASAASLINDLRAGSVQLHNRWQSCQATNRVSQDSIAASRADAAAADREASAARALAAARAADDQIRALQSYAREVSK